MDRFPRIHGKYYHSRSRIWDTGGRRLWIFRHSYIGMIRMMVFDNHRSLMTTLKSSAFL